MISNKSPRWGILTFPIFLALFISCEQTENRSSERLVFSVKTSAESPVLSYPSRSGGAQYFNIEAKGGAFLTDPDNELMSDSTVFKPHELKIEISYQSDLISYLLNPNGYRVNTQITLEGGSIIINHTNQ